MTLSTENKTLIGTAIGIGLLLATVYVGFRVASAGWNAGK